MSVNACTNNIQLFIQINTSFESPVCKNLGALITVHYKPYSSKPNAWFTLATFRDFCCLSFGDFITQRL